MKKSVILLIIVIFFTSNWIYADNVKEAYGVISRTLGYFPKNVKLISISQNKVSDRYIVYAKDGILYIEGTSVVAICRGFYEYVLGQVVVLKFHKSFQIVNAKRLCRLLNIIYI